MPKLNDKENAIYKEDEEKNTLMCLVIIFNKNEQVFTNNISWDGSDWVY